MEVFYQSICADNKVSCAILGRIDFEYCGFREIDRYVHEKKKLWASSRLNCERKNFLMRFTSLRHFTVFFYVVVRVAIALARMLP